MRATHATHGKVYAEGQPIDMVIAIQAAEWLTTLMSGQVTPAERQSWQTWRAAHPDHERAWTHIEKVSGGLQALDAKASRLALAPRPRNSAASRRQALSMLGWVAAIGLAAWGGARTQAARTLLADLSTPLGQRRSVTLADGSVLQMNGDSAVNLRFDGKQRRLELVRGEVFISTARETGQPYRPFLVETLHGQAQALGTRYSVRQDDERTIVAVEQGAVRLTPRLGTGSVTVQAGQAGSMTAHAAAPAHSVSADIWGWRHGVLLADDMLLRDLLHELSRYRHGFLGCDEAVAGLRISGVFPLADTDAVLASLPNSLPVDIRFRTRYWVQVEARAPR